MSTPFAAKAVTIGQLLDGNYALRVPVFQRDYAWTTNEAGQLLDDIIAALRIGEAGDDTEPSDYFIGAIVLLEATDAAVTAAEPKADAPRHHEIIDGLQRIVTLTILLSVARDLAAASPAIAKRAASAVAAKPDDDPKRAEPRLEVQEEIQPYFWSYIQRPAASAEMPDSDDVTTTEQCLLDVRELFIERLLDEPSHILDRLVTFLLDQCYCALITTHSIDRSHQIFSVLNDRGRPLGRSEILKAQILGAIPIDKRSHYSAIWRDLEKRMGGSLDGLLSQIRTIEGRTRNRIIQDIRTIVDQCGNPSAFIDNLLEPYGSILEAIQQIAAGQTPAPNSTADKLSPDARQLIVYLNWLGTSDWIAPLMLQWRVAQGDPAAVENFLKRLDRFAYSLRLLGVGADKRTARYQSILETMKAGELPEKGPPLDITRDEERLVIYNLRNIHARNQLTCKLLLLRLNDGLAGTPQRLDSTDLTVEHILPQKLPRKSLWRDWYPDGDERARCTQSLGNLALVPRGVNERARNLEFAQKKDIFFAHDDLPLITRDIADQATWQPGDVQDREARLFALLEQLWDITPSQSRNARQSASIATPRPRQDVVAAGQSAQPIPSETAGSSD
ncbi:MAG: DUF262 domain-containing HNH endonuclease family protein [Hyphomicrobiaceae bacterium]